MQTIFDEIVEKSADLSFEERRKLVEILRPQEIKVEKQPINPNVSWLKENRANFAGKYVALLNGKLVGQGRTIKEAHIEAKGNGVEKPLLTYIPREDEEIWGGW